MLISDTTLAASMKICILVVDENIAIFVVAMWLSSGDTDDLEDVVGLLEDKIHLLQRSIGCFGIEEVDSWENGSITEIKVS